MTAVVWQSSLPPAAGHRRRLPGSWQLKASIMHRMRTRSEVLIDSVTCQVGLARTESLGVPRLSERLSLSLWPGLWIKDQGVLGASPLPRQGMILRTCLDWANEIAVTPSLPLIIISPAMMVWLGDPWPKLRAPPAFGA